MVTSVKSSARTQHSEPTPRKQESSRRGSKASVIINPEETIRSRGVWF